MELVKAAARDNGGTNFYFSHPSFPILNNYQSY